MSKVKAAKLNRWATILSQKRYTIVHISGEENVWADLLTRWAISSPKLPTTASHNSTPQLSLKSNKTPNNDKHDIHHQASSFKLCALTLEAPIKPEAYDWPSREEIISSQTSRELKPPGVVIQDKLYSCLLYTSPSPRDKRQSRMPSSA